MRHHYFHAEERPHAAEWGYEGDLAPAHWGDLSPDYVLAKTGRQQSPIDIVNVTEKALPAIAFRFRPAPINLIYNGHTVEETEDGASFIEVDGKSFVLRQFHFHSPSEHTIDGRRADMEMHLVHESADGRVAVVAVMITAGAENAAFSPVWDHLPSAENRKRAVAVSVDAGELLPAERRYFRYTGSLTTPPCTEGVLWMVLRSPIELSPAQIDKFRAVIHGNNRPVQELNGRRIEVSR